MRKTLILDAGQRSALAVTRSLGRQGIEVFTAEESSVALASASKFSVTHFTYPSPKQEPDQFIQFLSKITKEQGIEILLPMTELTTQLLLLNQALFPNVKIPFPDIDAIESLANKSLLMKRAEALDIAIPGTRYVKNANKLPCKLEDLTYPIILKPDKSWVLHNGEWRRATVRLAKDVADAQNILDSNWEFSTHPFMIQECIDGQGAGVFAIYDQGKPLAFFSHRRLREKPPSGGVSVLSESASVDPLLAAPAEKLLSDANWHGVAMVEFKVAPDGTPYLMEINTRFWGSLQLAIDAGVDFPWLLYQLTCDKQPDAVTHYKTGVKLRWLLGDVDNLYLTLRDSHYSLIEKLSAAWRFLTPSLFKTRHEINRLNDLKPAWFELKQYLKDLIG